MPVTLSRFGFVTESVVMVTAFLRLPVAPGVKVTSIAQCPPGAIAVVHRLVWLKLCRSRPVTSMRVMTSGPVPVFVTRTRSGALGTWTTWRPNTSASGDQREHRRSAGERRGRELRDGTAVAALVGELVDAAVAADGRVGKRSIRLKHQAPRAPDR
jgi:hypothetical protein